MQIKINSQDLHSPANGRFIVDRPRFVHDAETYVVMATVKLQAASKAALITAWDTFKNTFNTKDQLVEVYLDAAESPWESVSVGGTLSTRRNILTVLTTADFTDDRATDTSMMIEVRVEATLTPTEATAGQVGPITIELDYDTSGYRTATLNAVFVRTGATMAFDNYLAARPGLLVVLGVAAGNPVTNERVVYTEGNPNQATITLTTSENPNLFTRAGKTDESLSIKIDPVSEWSFDPGAGPRPSIASFAMSVTADHRVYTDPLSLGIDGFLAVVRQQIERESRESTMELLEFDYEVDPNTGAVTVQGQYLLGNTVTLMYSRDEVEVETPAFSKTRDFNGHDDVQQRPGPNDIDRMITITRKGVGLVVLDPPTLPLSQQTQITSGDDFNQRNRQWLVVGIERGKTDPKANNWTTDLREQRLTYRLEAVNLRDRRGSRTVAGGIR